MENPLRLSWDELNALPRTTHTQDIHCVTRWSRFDVTFEGVHWSAIEPLVKPLPSAHYVVAHAEEGYTANVPIAFLRDPLSLIATHADGEPLTPEHGGPLRLVIPGKYFWKSAKWLRGIELTSTIVRASGSATATTTMPTRSRKSATGSEGSAIPPGRGRIDRGGSTTTWVPNPPQFFPL